jgi:serine/threonine protein kinase
METAIPHRVRIGAFELDLKAGELHKEARKIRLQEQPFQILRMLVERAGDLVTLEEIRRKLWPNDTIVEFDHSIHTAIKKLRQALDDSADKPAYIETVARRGYRLMAPVERVEANLAKATAPVVAPPEPGLSAASLTGKKISHYRVLEILGGGGMGLVYRAEDLKLGRAVALKFLPEELRNDPKALERFELEARAVSALDHPNICSIYEFDQVEGHAFISMQLLEGKTLREHLANGDFRLDDPAGLGMDVVIQISEGLAAAHEKGIIHRDIKPANIFITDKNVAKIVDFGVAKVLELAELPGRVLPVEASAAREQSAAPHLTRTGIRLGTAGYMSPEQVRGEKLDGRSDLFSFGLVLYEMATGQRAFPGQTAAAVQNAILNQAPVPVHDLNSRIPAKLEPIIIKALQKDCVLRYQSASEMHADLKLAADALPRSADISRVKLWGVAAVVGFSLLLLIAGGVQLAKRRTPTLPVVTQRQLTSNSYENGIVSGAISPDGRYLAYDDAKGIHIKSIETSVIQAIRPPDEYADKKMDWEIVQWFPDGTKFLADAHPQGEEPEEWSSQDTSIWSFSFPGGTSHKLRDNAISHSVSPDGSVISFGTNKSRFGDRELWSMGPAGEHAHRLFAVDDGSSLGPFTSLWSPDGKRVIHTRTDESGNTVLSRDLEGGAPSTVLPSSVANYLRDYRWLPDGRLLFSLAEPGAIAVETCNYWAMRVDLRTGKPIEKPTRVTDWSGFCMANSSMTADGKKYTFIRWRAYLSTDVADLDKRGTHVAHSKHLVFADSWDWPNDWTADSKALILSSNRTGHNGIYKQLLSEDSPHLLVEESSPVMSQRVSADGKWVLYLLLPKDGESGPGMLMRVPVDGGAAQKVFPAKGTKTGIRCARAPAGLCIIAEPTEDRTQAIVTVFDPVKGRGRELTRLTLDPNDDRWSLDLSQDGARMAAIRTPAAPISIVSLRGEATREIRVKGWTNLRSLNWAANGMGLFVSAGRMGEATLLYVDLQGNATVLWEHAGVDGAPASPDGRHLAIPSHTIDSNVWMIEDF